MGLFRNKEKATRSDDGIHYSDDQYAMGRAFVEYHLMQQGWRGIFVRPRCATGAITGFVRDASGVETPVEFYMRDLVRGMIRNDQVARLEYYDQVRQAKMILGKV